MTKTKTKTIALVALLAVASIGCGTQADCNGISSWVPQVYRVEVEAARNALGVCVDVSVYPEPFPCPGSSETGLCSGAALPYSTEVKVTYNPALGLGPDVGATAIEHELCHWMGIWSETEANACAARILPEVRAAVNAWKAGH